MNGPAEAIDRADAAVRAAAARAASDPGRPACHFRPAAGWMNDPNGTLYHDGWYHLFFQHNPFGDRWESMHWGHARSRDLVRWETLPVALAPAGERAEDHCFSGSAWRDRRGRPLLFYTSVRGDQVVYSAEQWAVRADDALRAFRRVDENPLLVPETPGQPAFGPTWRDPFVFEEEGRVFLILGADLPAEDGAPVIPIWEATDDALLDWRYRGILHRKARSEVEFFECPNLVRIGDRHLLLYSPYRAVEYVAGRFEPESATFRAGPAAARRGGAGRDGPAVRGRVDESSDFYATNLFAGAPDPEPVLVGWVRGWAPGRGWNGALSLPRLLSTSPEGELRQRPHPALEKLRGRELAGADVELEAGSRQAAADAAPAASLELEVVLRPTARESGFRLVEAEGERTVLDVSLRAGGRRAEMGGCAFDLPGRESDARTLRLFWDRSVGELFVDGGRRVCTRVIDSAAGRPVRVEWFARGGRARVVRWRMWELEPIW